MTATTKPTMGRAEVGVKWRMMEGRYLRTLRLKAGLTQAELANRAGLNDKQSISMVECGYTHCPPHWLRGLSETLEVPPVVFGKAMLRTQNPWLYALLFGESKQLASELQRAANGKRGRQAVVEASKSA